MEDSEECRDTLNMKEGLEECNNILPDEGKKQILLSLDVEKMYPSLKKEIVIEEIYQVVRDSNIEISNQNWTSK